jgi:proteic killer suppression protein
MMRSFADEETEAVYLIVTSPKWANASRVAARRLQAVDFASAIEDVVSPPGIRLQKLSGDRQGWWSIRANGQQRVCIRWEGRKARDVGNVGAH